MPSAGRNRFMNGRLMATDVYPDLHELIRAHGGYAKITSEAWAEFDAQVTRWKSRHRPQAVTDEQLLAGLPTVVSNEKARVCTVCKARARFGYRGADGWLEWYCAEHRKARAWADARVY